MLWPVDAPPPVEELEYHGAVLLNEKGRPAAGEEEKVVAFVINRIEATQGGAGAIQAS